MSATDSVFEVIEEQIVMGKLASGERLDEQSLADQFNVSRTPIREALARLDSADLVEKRKGQRGYFAKAPTVTRLIEMFEVMAELEGMCARLAARRMSDAAIEQLVAANQGCLEASTGNGADEYYAKNVDFHELIYTGCGNAFLAEETRAIRRRLRSFRRLQLRVRGRMLQSHDEHSQIIAAIMAGDSEQAERLSRDHVAIQGERFADFIAHLG